MKFGWDLRPSVCPVPLLVTCEPVGQENAQQDVTDKEKLWDELAGDLASWWRWETHFIPQLLL